MRFFAATLLLLLAITGSTGVKPDRAEAATSLKLLSLAGWLAQLEPLTVGQRQVGGAAAIAAYWRAERDASTLAIGSGNSFGSSPPLSNLFKDEPAALALNALDLDVDTLGNDNFDHGIAYLQHLIDLAEYDYVAANLRNLDANLQSVRRYRIFDIGGVKVGVIGVVGPDSPLVVFPGNFGTIEVTDPAIAATSAREEARRAGAQVFVLTTEMTLDSVSPTGALFGGLVDLATRATGFDVVLGTSATGADYSATIGDSLVVAQQRRGVSYARTSLQVEGGRVVAKSVDFVSPVVAAITPDPQLDSLVRSYRSELSGELTKVIGTSTSASPQADACGNAVGRTCESTTGNLVADAMRLTYGTDFAIVNAGGIRVDLTCPATDRPDDFCPPFSPPPFPITEGQVEALLPFANIAVVQRVTGAELKAMLENGVSQLPATEGRFPQVSGLCFAYDLARPAGNRVIALARQLPGGACATEALDLSPAESYMLTTSDFIAAGGDGYPVAKDPPHVRNLLVEVVSNFVREHQPVAPALQGRIVCLSSGTPACPPTTAPRPVIPPIGPPGASITPPRTGDAGLR